MKPDIIHIAALEAKDARIKELEERNQKLTEALSKVPLFRMTEDALGWECCGCGAVAGITADGKDRNEPCKPGCYVDIVEAAIALKKDPS